MGRLHEGSEPSCRKEVDGGRFLVLEFKDGRGRRKSLVRVVAGEAVFS